MEVEKFPKTDIMYFFQVEDVQDEAREILGRDLNDDELFEVKDKLSDFIHWDYYVRTAIREITQSDGQPQN